MGCCNPCCHGSSCNIALRTLSLILGLLAFCIHTAALGHTYWLCLEYKSSIIGTNCENRMSLFTAYRGVSIFATTSELKGSWTKACAAFAILAAGSSWMAFIFMCVRFCVVKKIVEYATLFFLFGAFGCEFLVWVIFVALMPKLGERINDDYNTVMNVKVYKNIMTANGGLGQGFGCSVCSMVFSFLCFVMIAASVKITGPIVKNPKTVVVVGNQAVVAQNGQQVVVIGNQQPQYQPQQQQQGQVTYAQQQQQPPAYGADEQKQPGAY